MLHPFESNQTRFFCNRPPNSLGGVYTRDAPRVKPTQSLNFRLRSPTSTETKHYSGTEGCYHTVLPMSSAIAPSRMCAIADGGKAAEDVLARISRRWGGDVAHALMRAVSSSTKRWRDMRVSGGGVAPKRMPKADATGLAAKKSAP